MKYLFVFINLVLITLAVYFSVDGAYIFLGNRLTPSRILIPACDESAPLKKSINSDLREKKFYKSITDRNLFQVDVHDDSPPVEDPVVNEDSLDNLEKTRLDLKLWGTVSSPRMEAFAVIEENKKRKQELYKEGDTVQGAVIKTILRRRVVLTFKGRDQILEMSLENKNQSPAYSKKTPPAWGKQESITIDRDTIDESVSDISKLMKQVRIRPHFSGGKPDGLLLYGIKPKSLFREMGLRNGDIILGVDGSEIKSVDDALTLYRNLRNANDVNLSIKRNGTIKEIDYHVQ